MQTESKRFWGAHCGMCYCDYFYNILLASKGAVIVLKSEMLAQNSSTSQVPLGSCINVVRSQSKPPLGHSVVSTCWFPWFLIAYMVSLSFTQPEPSPVRARPKLKARTCSTCPHSPAVEEEAGSSGELSIRMTPVAQSELRLKWTGMDLELRTRAIDPFWYFCKSHPSFSNLPIEIKGEVTAAIIKRSRKTTWPNCTSAILAPLTLIGLPCASMNFEPPKVLSGCPTARNSRGRTDPSAPESKTTSTSQGSESPTVLMLCASLKSEINVSLGSCKEKHSTVSQHVHKPSSSLHVMSKCSQPQQIDRC